MRLWLWIGIGAMALGLTGASLSALAAHRYGDVSGKDRSWVSDEEKARTRTTVVDVETMPGTPETDATVFWLDAARTKCLRVNYDEAKAGVSGKDYMLEDPLSFTDGRKVRNAADWSARRREILHILEQNEYGVMPPAPPTNRVYLIAEKLMDSRFAWERRYRQTFRPDGTGPAVDWLLYVPVHSRGRVPVIIGLNYRSIDRIAETLRDDHYRIPIDAIIARGYAYLTADYRQFTADPRDNAEFAAKVYDGVYELWGWRDPKRKDLTGALMAWAWGLCRGLDLAERVEEIDAERSVVIGSSRLGKAALLAGAFDERFRVVIPNQTGGGGVDLLKHRYAEDGKSMHALFPHWFCARFWEYEDDPWKQPFDQHLLLAAVAPRNLLLECYHKKWFDPTGEFLAAQAAAPVWKFLTGRTFDAPTLPEAYSDAYVKPPFGYATRTECHGLAPYDWLWALDFADQVFY